MTAAIFWLKTRGRWKETHVTEVGGVNGSSVKLDVQESGVREALLTQLAQMSPYCPLPCLLRRTPPPAAASSL